MRASSRLVLLVGIVVAALVYPEASAAQWVLYDDFTDPLIDPLRWFGSDTSGGAANGTTDVIRAIKGGKLQLLIDQYGRADSNSGVSRGATDLMLVDPASINTIRAKVAVTAAVVEACPTNPSPAVRARAAILGSFFNDGSGSGSDRTGDVLAGIQKVADVVGGQVTEAYLARCLDPACSTFGLIGSGAQWFPGTWAVDEGHVLSLVWDEPNDRFVYSLKAAGLLEQTIVLPYPPSLYVKAPIAPYRALQVNNSAANCVGSQRRAFMEARFDNVFVKP